MKKMPASIAHVIVEYFIIIDTDVLCNIVKDRKQLKAAPFTLTLGEYKARVLYTPT